MATGTVKWFNNAKGYGFIRPDEGGEDLFVHYSYIEMEGYKSLKARQAVTYATQQAGKGFHAIDIQFVDTEGANSSFNDDEADIQQSSTSAQANELEPA